MNEAEARGFAEVAALQRRVEDGRDYRDALDALAAAEARGDHPAALALYRLKAAFFAPLPSGDSGKAKQ